MNRIDIKTPDALRVYPQWLNMDPVDDVFSNAASPLEETKLSAAKGELLVATRGKKVLL